MNGVTRFLSRRDKKTKAVLATNPKVASPRPFKYRCLIDAYPLQDPFRIFHAEEKKKTTKDEEKQVGQPHLVSC